MLVMKMQAAMVLAVRTFANLERLPEIDAVLNVANARMNLNAQAAARADKMHK